mgnify:CR=1 FL=1
MRNLNDFYLFVQAVDCQGFAPASRQLGIPKATLSKRVAALEKALGVRLIQRTSRSFVVTDTGKDFYRHAAAEDGAGREVLDLALAVDRRVGDDGDRLLEVIGEVLPLGRERRQRAVVAERADRLLLPQIDEADAVVRGLPDAAAGRLYAGQGVARAQES